MDVYLDTNLWNALFNQSVHVDALLDSLDKRDIRLVLSDESLYELAKTFLRRDDTGKEHPGFRRTFHSDCKREHGRGRG